MFEIYFKTYILQRIFAKIQLNIQFRAKIFLLLSAKFILGAESAIPSESPSLQNLSLQTPIDTERTARIAAQKAEIPAETIHSSDVSEK